MDGAKRGIENALRAKPLEIKEHYERQLKELQEAYGEAMLELRTPKNCSSCWASRAVNSSCAFDSSHPNL